jgi:transposase-like protein
MAQHFLLSPACRTLSETKVARMSEDEAREVFGKLRWAKTGGEAFCPRCGCLGCYHLPAKRKWRCKGCGYDFSVTSGTIFADRKMPFRDILLAIYKFVNAAKGLSALQLSRELGCDYKVAFVLLHKLRECMESETAGHQVGGDGEAVEVDGAYFGGHVRPANLKADRKDRRLAENQTGKRRWVGVIRQRGGRTLPFVVDDEAALVPVIGRRVRKGTTIHADEAAAYDALHARFDMKRINHQVAYSLDGACTNGAEGYFSRLRRAEWGIHHHISGQYLRRYAAEMAWREDHRREDNSAVTSAVVSLGMARGQSVASPWTGGATGAAGKTRRSRSVRHPPEGARTVLHRGQNAPIPLTI